MAQQKTFSQMVAEIQQEHASKQPTMSTLLKSNQTLSFGNSFDQFIPFAQPTFSKLFKAEESKAQEEDKPEPPLDCPCRLKKLTEQPSENTEKDAGFNQFNTFSIFPTFNNGFNYSGLYENTLAYPYSNIGWNHFNTLGGSFF